VSRVIDPGAVFAGWVGLGMALVTVIALELIIAIQSLVIIAAPVIGLLIGGYANVRSERWYPRGRAIANAAYAGLVTGLALAAMYVALRLLFVYADSGSRPDGSQIVCQPGPDCTYQRYVELGQREELAAIGVTDGATFLAATLREQLNGALTLTILTMGGAVAAGTVRAVRGPRPGSVAYAAR
jgi:hypothetical protein